MEPRPGANLSPRLPPDLWNMNPANQDTDGAWPASDCPTSMELDSGLEGGAKAACLREASLIVGQVPPMPGGGVASAIEEFSRSMYAFYYGHTTSQCKQMVWGGGGYARVPAEFLLAT